MPTVAGPFGMEFTASLVAATTNLANRQAWIDPTNAGAIYNGDVARINATGYVEKDTGTATLTPCGVFSGFEFTSLVTKQRLQSSFFPGAASVLTTDPIWAYINDDPNALFAIQASVAVTTRAAALSMIGSNAAIVQTAGNATFGRSKNALGAVATTASLPLRIIDFVRTPNNPVPPVVADGKNYFMNVLVKFNTHAYNTALGV